MGFTSKRTMKTLNTSTFDELPASGFIRQSQLIPYVVPFSSATLWRKCKDGTFPKPVKLSQRVAAWNVGSVRAWMAVQAAA
jgi:prophage regulatory protein